jgi:hypothetical protein
MLIVEVEFGTGFITFFFPNTLVFRLTDRGIVAYKNHLELAAFDHSRKEYR